MDRENDELLMNWATAVSLLERERTFKAGRVAPGPKRIPKMSLRMSALAEVSGHIDRFVEFDLEVPVKQQRGRRWLCMGP